LLLPGYGALKHPGGGFVTWRWEMNQRIEEAVRVLLEAPKIIVRSDLPFTSSDGEIVHCVKTQMPDYQKKPTVSVEHGLQWPMMDVWLVSQFAMDRAQQMVEQERQKKLADERRRNSFTLEELEEARRTGIAAFDSIMEQRAKLWVCQL
jgi:hypothetical protein